MSGSGIYRTTSAALLIVALSVVAEAEVPATCTDRVIAPTVANVIQGLQSANALSNDLDKRNGILKARTSFRQTLRTGTTAAACLSASAQSQLLASVLELRRIDKQVGVVGGGAGSTSLVSSGSVPALLGLAIEHGGLTETFNGTTATFTTTPAKLVAAMAKVYGPNTKPPSDSSLRALERVSLSISFDTSRSDSTNTKTGSNLLANYQQLAQASARFVLLNDRDPFAPRNWQKILDFANSAPALELANAAEDLLAPLTPFSGYGDALDDAMKSYDELVAANPNPAATALTNIFNSYVRDLAALTAKVPDWKQRVDKYVAARIESDARQASVYKSFARAPTLTFIYAFNRPPVVAASSMPGASGTTSSAMLPTAASPDLSSATLIFAASLGDSDYTLNARFSFFDDTRPTMRGNFRDFQLSGKWDIPVGALTSLLAKGTLTFSGLYEHLHQKPLGINLTINDQTVNQPGNMRVLQVKYSIPVGDSGVQIPISFTTSNRTELVNEKENRGNIGITFDLDKLFVKK